MEKLNDKIRKMYENLGIVIDDTSLENIISDEQRIKMFKEMGYV